MPRNVLAFPTPPGLPFSAAVWAGDILYMSGQVGFDIKKGALVSGGVASEAEQIITNAKAVLAAAGKTLDDVVKANIYLVRMSDFAAVNEVYARSFAAPYPARTAIGVAALPLGASVEMEFIIR
ncbi:MAG TPA: Rid family detoxifying hydrolase [Parvularculaceae bacterium]|nr:Rid family detoxifying hydrolase [Parvularculaceae bacterium]